MILPSLDLEKNLNTKGLKVVIGIDEAGRGPLAGPVVAGAVWIDIYNQHSTIKTWEDKIVHLVRDSKTLSPAQREKAYALITKHFAWGIGWCDHKTIDRMNILQATYLAMKKALSDLRRKLNKEADFILLDGNKDIPNFSYSQRAIINGDKHIFSIAAASIVAKVTRDRMMLEFHRQYPDYGFDQHKGYGTQFHLDRLEVLGPCPIHRRSFRRIKDK